MAKLFSSLACNLDADILGASLPLLEESRVEAIEWSFDTLYRFQEIPPWFSALLTAFGTENRLIGHGVFFSLFSGKWLPGQQDWIKLLKKTCTDFHFDHITEHFGFMTGRDFHHGAPLNIPYSASTLAIGRDRLKRISETCCCPVGLENLAFSYSLDEVKRHGDFLEKLLEPVNGFIILDLHNLYCQIHNFSIAYDEIIALYPLDKVREIHISGGSWEDGLANPRKKIRRDTHDEAVPNEVFSLLERTIRKCPTLKYVVLEQLGTGLKTEESKKLFYEDFLRLENIVQGNNKLHRPNPCHSFLPALPFPPYAIEEDEALYEQQLQLSLILETSTSFDAAIDALHRSSLAHTDWKIEEWEPNMIETALKIAQKWKK
ncbi:multinuclear nonheme iron-dependent oxidase [Flavitalea flava]